MISAEQLLGNAEAEELAASRISKEELKKLADMWAKGFHVEWRRLLPKYDAAPHQLADIPFC